jgi:hypothetical protein
MEVVALFAADDAVHSVYLEGSRADGSALPTSDLDITVVLHYDICEEQKQRIAELLDEVRRNRAALNLDIETTTVDRLWQGATPMFKHASRLLHGTDLRPDVPLMPIARWTRDRMHASYWLATHIFGRPTVARIPLPYPRPAGAFRGYDNRIVTTPDGQTQASTRNLVRVTGWIATALVALRAGQYIARKREVPSLYCRWVGDGWSTLLHDIHTLCRDEWHYLIPTEPDAQQQLRTICTQTLAFENDFMRHYRRWILGELCGDDPAQRHARFVQGLLPFADDDVQAALAAAGGPITHFSEGKD